MGVTVVLGGLIAFIEAARNPKVREKFGDTTERISDRLHRSDRVLSRRTDDGYPGDEGYYDKPSSRR